jgi:hypothetical protein
MDPMTETSVYVATGASASDVEAVVSKLLPADYKAWGVDTDAVEYDGYVMAVDLHHRPEDELNAWATRIRDEITSQLGVDARTERELDDRAAAAARAQSAS